MNNKFAAAQFSYDGGNGGIDAQWVGAETHEKLKKEIKKGEKVPHPQGDWLIFERNDEGGKYNPFGYLKIQDGKEDVEHQF